MSSEVSSKSGVCKRGRWGRRLFFCGIVTVIILTVVLVLFHRPILTGFARGLIVTGKIHQTADILIWNGDHCFDVAAQQFQQNPERRILILDSHPNRLVQLGIVQSERAKFQQELHLRQIPLASQEVIEGAARDDWEAGKFLLTWLNDHPQKTVAVLCEEFQSGQISTKLHRILKTEMKRVTVHALTDRRFGADNWWKTRAGCRRCVLAWINRIDTWCRGVPSERLNSGWSPDEYERQLSELHTNSGIVLDQRKRSGWLPSIAEWLDRGEPPAKVDHILLLPGDETVRPFVAAALVKTGFANDVLVPRNFPTPQEADGLTDPTHEVTRKVLLARGVPDDKIIILPGHSDSTFGDARVATAFLRKNPHETFAVVTSFYHIRRAKIAFRSIHHNEFDRFLFVAAPSDGFSAENWWTSQAGTFLIAAEFLKLGLYWIQYGSGIYWILTILIALTGVMIVVQYRMRLRARRQAHPELRASQTV